MITRLYDSVIIYFSAKQCNKAKCMIDEGYLDCLLPSDETKVLNYWKSFLEDLGDGHPMAGMDAARLSRTIPVVLYGDEGSNNVGQNGFMLGTWTLTYLWH